MLLVTFTIGAFRFDGDTTGYEGVGIAFILLLLNYIGALVLHFFLNGRYRRAKPMEELIGTFLYLFVLLCLIMAITMHLLPKFKSLEQAQWVGLAVVGVKFTLDASFWFFRRKPREQKA